MLFVVARAVNIAEMADEIGYEVDASRQEWSSLPETKSLIALLCAMREDELVGVSAVFDVGFHLGRQDRPPEPGQVVAALKAKVQEGQDLLEAQGVDIFAELLGMRVIQRACRWTWVEGGGHVLGDGGHASKAIDRVLNLFDDPADLASILREALHGS